ncbi:hypothetical protein [Curtobacterium sp. VKM Ac-2884]|uniref:hypothetical protein n=1 Tax=Curtobacterium sp. VKM Ac-2884 TaxID=2783818 RepID=UPI00188AC212|nr:hypothetical protein [Curtobacterium sp. VKM Ac-2884]MBF4603725.1 hypothetical protein [Curtobacterium sp. VKM Ac-2884]
MADERKCYAGDLGSDALGKTVAVPVTGLDGAHTGTLSLVSHFMGVAGKPVTELRFSPSEVLGSSKVLTVDDAVTVEVRR